jgi:hypothetical protein
MDKEEFKVQFEGWCRFRAKLMSTGRYVKNPVLVVPIGVFMRSKKKGPRFICIASDNLHAILYRNAPDEMAREKVRDKYISAYESKKSAEDRFDKSLEETRWILLEANLDLLKKTSGVLAPSDCGCEVYRGENPKKDAIARKIREWVAGFNGEESRWEGSKLVQPKEGKCWLAEGLMKFILENHHMK